MEKKEIIGKLEEEHKETIKQWASNYNKDKQELLETLCEAFEDDEVKEAYGDDYKARISYAMNVVKGRLGNEVDTQTEDIEIEVLGVKGPKTVSTKNGPNELGQIFGVGAVKSVDSLKTIEVTGWGEEAFTVEDLEHGGCYKMNVSRQSSVEGEKVEYNFESHTKIEEVEMDTGNISKLLKEFFPKVEIPRASEHKSKSRDDYKLIRGIIENIDFLKDKNDNPLARVDIMGQSSNLKDVEETGLFSVMMDPSMAKYGPDSDVCFVGTIDVDDEYGASMFAQGVTDVIGFEYERDPSEIEEEELSEEDVQETIAEKAVAEDVEDDYEDELI